MRRRWLVILIYAGLMPLMGHSALAQRPAAWDTRVKTVGKPVPLPEAQDSKNQDSADPKPKPKNKPRQGESRAK